MTTSAGSFFAFDGGLGSAVEFALDEVDVDVDAEASSLLSFFFRDGADTFSL